MDHVPNILKTCLQIAFTYFMWTSNYNNKRWLFPQTYLSSLWEAVWFLRESNCNIIGPLFWCISGFIWLNRYRLSAPIRSSQPWTQTNNTNAIKGRCLISNILALPLPAERNISRQPITPTSAQYASQIQTQSTVGRPAHSVICIYHHWAHRQSTAKSKSNLN
jgi:hypothetical protein